VILGAAFVVGGLDWMLHLDDPGVRIVFALTIIASGCWVGWNDLILPLRTRLSDIDIALRIEQRYPDFRDALASAVQFIESRNDPQLGSPELQRRVIAQTLTQVERVDASEVIDARRVAKTATVVACLLVLALGAVLLDAGTTVLAFERLFLPLTAPDWPRKTELRLVRTDDLRPFDDSTSQPLRAAQGQTLDFCIENTKGPIPGDAVLVFRNSAANETVVGERHGDDTSDVDKSIVQELRRTTLRDQSDRPRDVGIAAWVVRPGEWEFRAIGGDDDTMPWRKLQSVAPPRLEEFQVRVTPPAYTGLPEEVLPPGVGLVQGFVGTEVNIRARASKPLESAAIQIAGAAVHTSGPSDGTVIASFIIKRSGRYSYELELTDDEGFQNVEVPRYEIHADEDLIPDVYIERPRTDLQVTANAVVPLRIVAKDDLGLKEMRISYRSRTTSDDVGVLWSLWAESHRPQQRAVDVNWNLAQLSLRQGTDFAFHAEATDDFDLGPEHVGKSLVRMLRVVSAEKKLGELTARQGGLLEDVDRVSQMQSRAHSQVGELLVQLTNAGELRRTDIDLLKQVEFEQRRISGQLLNSRDGIDARTRELSAEMQYNNLESPAMKRRLDEMIAELGQLREHPLPAIEQMLTRVRKTLAAGASLKRPVAENSDARDTLNPEALAKIQHEQAIVREALETIVENLSLWKGRTDLLDEVTEIIDEQKVVSRDTKEAHSETLTKPFGALTSQERADLARLAIRQRRLSNQLTRFRKTLSKTADASSEPLNASQLRDAELQMDRQATASRMREAAERIEKNRVGAALGEQEKIQKSLEELEQLLTNSPYGDAQGLVEKLMQIESQIDSMLLRQEQLHDEVQNTLDIKNAREREPRLERLRKQQQALADEMGALSRRLRRLRAPRASTSGARAATRMQEADEALSGGDVESATASQQEALGDLEQVRREVARKRIEEEMRLAQELLERLADELTGVVKRQQSIIDESLRLDEARKQRGNWSRAQLISLRRLAENQLDLKSDIDRTAHTLRSVEVFAIALRGASKHMQTAADRVTRKQLDAETLTAQRAAKQRVVDLIDALKPEPPTDGGDRTSQTPANAGDNAQTSPAERFPLLAQLKMLKKIQRDINQRTSILDRQRGQPGALSEGELAELEALAREQGELADLIDNLTGSTADIPQSDQQRPAQRGEEGSPAVDNDAPLSPAEKSLLESLEK